MVQVLNVTKRIKGQTILDDVSLTAEAGSVIGIIGPSGAGKSTLLRLLAGVEGADAGSLQLLEYGYSYPCNPVRMHRPWPTVSLVFQGLCLWPHMTLLRNVMLPLEALGVKDGEERAVSLLERFGLQSLTERYPNQVSGGQRQLFALCRSMALQPRVLLLDEVTAALDVEHVRTLKETLLELRDNGVLIVLVSHSIGFIRRTANRVVFMDHGQIHEAADVSILSSPQTERLKGFLLAADELDEVPKR